MTHLLAIEQLRGGYGHVEVLRGVDLHVNAGEVVALLGSNGASKSTLNNTVCGLFPAWSGRVVFDGMELTKAHYRDVVRAGLIQVPEGRRVFARLTVEENLAMGGFFSEKAEYQTQLDKVLQLFPRLKERFAQRAGTMSGGEQQMLAIGRALMSQPKLLLLDEPSLGLAPIIIQQIFAIIEQLRKDGVTVFLVEQNANQALKLADRAYVLENGRIVMQGSGAELLVNPKVRDAYLGG